MKRHKKIVLTIIFSIMAIQQTVPSDTSSTQEQSSTQDQAINSEFYLTKRINIFTPFLRKKKMPIQLYI